ncbi:MAG: aminodeoxychorismate/anthranilate synthase component II [Candidatus Zixiibacteriota bacterium]
MILIIDNYDSFTYNLVQYFGELGGECHVARNNEITIEQAINLNPTHLVISPGPGRPRDAGISVDMIKYFSDKMPILGVCLGHQCLAEAFGGNIDNAEILMHGKISSVYHTGDGLFLGVPSPFEATRYHSLIVREESLPDCLHITAHTDDGEIMALRLSDKPVVGVQFHPESILTPYGKNLLSNFLSAR